ncbi:MAG: glycosyltransferase [Candidatus Melainabacteria bacterium]|nr:glycosyltransferase [Candidatus Melainabacteria bacterium]
MPDTSHKPRVLIFIVAYNAEKTIESVLKRIPDSLRDYDTEILIIDDSSKDKTFEAAEAARIKGEIPYPINVLRNPLNQRYGGNQKIGYHYAIERGFDFVALVHGDGQYAPEALPRLLEPLVKGEAEAVFGSRMMTLTGALEGGMPLYKYVGNRILTAFQNQVLGSCLSEFHTGYRIYSTKALAKLPFHLNTNDFHFDTEIIIQFIVAGFRIKELPIPTFYGEEVCHVNGLKYAWDVVKASGAARLQQYCLMYRRNFDVQPAATDSWKHRPKLAFESSQTAALALIKPNTRVLTFGGDSAIDLIPLLEQKGCQVTVLDRESPISGSHPQLNYYQHDPDSDDRLPIDVTDHDYILMLDVIEQAHSPEDFLAQLMQACTYNSKANLIVSSANIGFFVTRWMHLFGQFNYSKKGILDLRHTRLFTFDSLQRVISESGFEVINVEGVPAPYPLVIKNEKFANFLLSMNSQLIKVRRTLFAYQILVVAKPVPTLPALLRDAVGHSKERLEQTEAPADREIVGSAR